MSTAALDFAAGVAKRDALSAAQRGEARLLALRIIRDDQYQRVLLSRAQNGGLPPAIEAMLWHYAYGKPPDRVELGRIGDADALAELSREELKLRALALVDILSKPPEEDADGAAQELAATEARLTSLIERRISQQRTLPPPSEIGEMLDDEPRAELEAEF